MKKEEILDLAIIRTKDGLFISDDPNNTGNYTCTYLNKYKINGKIPKKAFHKKWVFMQDDQEITSIKESMPEEKTNYRYVLEDPSFEDHDKGVLAYFHRDEIAYKDDDYCWQWKDDVSHLRSLYRETHDIVPAYWKEVDFTAVVVMELDHVQSPCDFSFEVYNENHNRWGDDDRKFYYTGEHVQKQILDTIIFPSLVQHETECKISSHDLYKIVRTYIKNNINNESAEITSDYDFCFTVQKKIKLDEPYTQKTEIKTAKGKSYKNRKYRSRYITERMVEVYEMTHSPKSYSSYTPIAGMQAKNLQELKDKIDNLCQELIEMINEPLKDCPHCKGMGVVEDTKNADTEKN